MNVIKNIRLKISNLFNKNTPTTDRTTTSGSFVSNLQKLKNQDLSGQEEIDILRHLAGLGKLRHQSALEKAHQQLVDEEVDKEYKRLLKDPAVIQKAKENAIEKAEAQMKEDEYALAVANAMEGRHRKIVDEEKAFRFNWKKFSKSSIKKRDPEVKDFRKFLIKYDYVAKDLLKEIAVTAIFVDNEITNFNIFRIEMMRIDNLQTQ